MYNVVLYDWLLFIFIGDVVSYKTHREGHF